MDESNAIRAITIGVSTFIAIMTISAVMLYYTSAKEAVNAIGTGTDVAQNYSDYVRNLLLKDTITGAEFKNILNYYYMNDRVQVNFSNEMTGMGSVYSPDGGGAILAVTTPYGVPINMSDSIYNTFMSNIISQNIFSVSVEYYDSDERNPKTITVEQM